MNFFSLPLRFVVSLIVVLAASPVAAAFEYPAIAKTVSTVESLVPKDWSILYDVAKGDLNEDGIEDAALVIEYKEAVEHNVLLWTFKPTEPEIYDAASPPRVLLILFGRKAGGYIVKLANSNIISRADMGGVIGDPFQGAIIDRGSIVISEYGGSSLRWSEDYRFRYRNNKWRLIGFTSTSTNIATGKSTIKDQNFLSGKMKIATTETENEDEIPKVKWKTIDKTKRQFYLKSNMTVIDTP